MLISALNAVFGRPTDEWEHYLPFFSTKTLIDGTRSSGHMMRRRVGQTFEYRRKTDEEEADWFSMNAR